MQVGSFLVIAVCVILLLLILVFLYLKIGQISRNWGDVEWEGADIGLTSGVIKLKKNNIDRQIAYKLWLELNTRKIGLPIDLNHDVIHEVYNSWYIFFGIAREMLKELSVDKVGKDKNSDSVANVAIEVLNVGMRPHLTKWQAKYRRWYGFEEKNNEKKTPQEIQRLYPEYMDLAKDMMKVNGQLVEFKIKLEALAFN